MKSNLLLLSLLCLASCSNSPKQDSHSGKTAETRPDETAGKQFDLKKLTVIEDLKEVPKSDYLSLSAKPCDSLLFLNAKVCPYMNYTFYDTKNNHIRDLRLQAGKLTFKPDSKQGFYYHGFLPESQTYVLTENSIGDGGLYFGDLILINKADTVAHRIISGYSDGPPTGPAESPDGKLLAYYENAGYHHQTSYLTVLKVDQKEKGQAHFLYLGDLESEAFEITEIRWSDNRTLVIRANHHENGIAYYQVSI